MATGKVDIVFPPSRQSFTSFIELCLEPMALYHIPPVHDAKHSTPKTTQSTTLKPPSCIVNAAIMTPVTKMKCNQNIIYNLPLSIFQLFNLSATTKVPVVVNRPFLKCGQIVYFKISFFLECCCFHWIAIFFSSYNNHGMNSGGDARNP